MTDWIDGFPPDSHWLTDAQRPQWRADIAALRDLRLAEEQHPLRQGDLYNELKQRWGLQMPALAREAGLSYHAARQRARVAEAIPPGSPLRDLDLPYSILRLLAPLADPEPWAQRALALRDEGQLRVRSFACLLEDAGLRHRRTPPPPDPACLQCGSPVPDTPARLTVRGSQGVGSFCGPVCARDFFLSGRTLPPCSPPPPPRLAQPRLESQSRAPGSAPMPHAAPTVPPPPAAATPESQSPPPAPEASDPDTGVIMLRGRFIGQWKRRPRPW